MVELLGDDAHSFVVQLGFAYGFSNSDSQYKIEWPSSPRLGLILFRALSVVRRITASRANTGQGEMISATTVTLTKAKILSALSLSVNGQAGTGNPSPPGVGNEFTFSPSILLASGASLTFTLKATIGSNTASISPSILSGRVAYASDGPSSGAPS
jgi:hypothetical protein